MNKILTLLCTLLLVCGLSFGQQTGTTNFGASDHFTADSIDLATLTPSVNVPVLTKGGAFPFELNLTATSSCSIAGTGTQIYTYCTLPYTFSSQGIVGLQMGYTSA